MKVVQILPTIAYGDAVGNDTLAIQEAIKSLGYESPIYAENIDAKLPLGTAISIKKIPQFKDDDILIYHNSVGSDISFSFDKYKGRKIMIYHNITPSEYYYGYNQQIVDIINYGLKGVRYLSDKVEYCLADSEFNKKDLLDAGYKCKIDVLPILIPFDDYKKEPDKNIIKKYDDDWTNIIFVGRVVPNKKQEDLIKSFCYYKKHINPKSRLFLVGGCFIDTYYNKLKNYILALGVQDIFFTDHIKFNEILAYYKIADVFLCMSEHEGFCVPLVESMVFNVPIIAYDSSAISWTLGGSGILIDDKDPVFVSKIIDLCVTNKEVRDYVIKKQKSRLNDFAYEKIKNQFLCYLKDFIDRNK